MGRMVGMDQVEYNQRQLEEAKPRAERIVRLRAAGETLQSIATLLGISRERVRQIEAREARRQSESNTPQRR